MGGNGNKLTKDGECKQCDGPKYRPKYLYIASSTIYIEIIAKGHNCSLLYVPMYLNKNKEKKKSKAWPAKLPLSNS